MIVDIRFWHYLKEFYRRASAVEQNIQQGDNMKPPTVRYNRLSYFSSYIHRGNILTSYLKLPHYLDEQFGRYTTAVLSVRLFRKYFELGTPTGYMRFRMRFTMWKGRSKKHF